MNANWPKAVAHRIGMGGEIQFTTTRIGQTLHVPCRGNGRHIAHIVDVPIAPGQNPEAVAKKLLAQGWQIGHRLLCPARSPKTEQNIRAKQRKEQILASAACTTNDPTELAAIADQARRATVEVTPPAPEPKVPTPAAGRARRLVYMALEESYDEMRKCYKKDQSDALIAKDCDVSEQFVRTIREESYGPIVVPPDFTALKAEVDKLRREITAAHTANMSAIVALENKLKTEVDELLDSWK